jgi:uncharacterized membrane protein
MLTVSFVLALLPAAWLSGFVGIQRGVILREFSTMFTSSCWCQFLRYMLPASMQAAVAVKLDDWMQRVQYATNVQDAHATEQNASRIFRGSVTCLSAAFAIALVSMVLIWVLSTRKVLRVQVVLLRTAACIAGWAFVACGFAFLLATLYTLDPHKTLRAFAGTIIDRWMQQQQQQHYRK